jgi:tetratricopeptide (TPR) repeat protein
MNINPGRVGTILLILGVVGAGASGSSVPSTNRQRVALDPKVAALVKQAHAAEKAQRYDLEIRYLTAALNMKPGQNTSAAIYGWRAFAHTCKGEFSNAMADANESIRLNPRYYGGYLERGIVYRRTGSLDKAIGEYDTTIRLNPNFDWAYYDRAIAYGLKGDYEQSIRDSTEAIRLNPNEPGFYYNRGVSYQSIGKLDKALADYNKAIHLAPNDLNNYCGRASACEDMGRLDKASADYDRVSRLNARDANDYRFRGFAHFAKGNYKAAAFDLQKAVRLSPRDYDALVSLAWFQATCPEDSLRNGKEALETSRRACEVTNWKSYDAVDTLAAAYAETGDFDKAIKYETQALNMKGVYATRRKEMQERLELYRQHKPYRKESKFKAHESRGPDLDVRKGNSK